MWYLKGCLMLCSLRYLITCVKDFPGSVQMLPGPVRLQARLHYWVYGPVRLQARLRYWVYLNYFHIWNIRIFQVPSERATSDKNLLDKLAAIADEIEELGNDYHTARKLGEVHQRSASTRIQEAVSGSAQDTVQISLK